MKTLTYTEAKEIIKEHGKETIKSFINTPKKLFEHYDIIEALCDEEGIELNYNDTLELNELIDSKLEDDFYIEFSEFTHEYRLIHDTILEETHEEYLEETIKECYLHNVPENVHQYIDFDKWVDDFKADGVAHSFSSYDGYTHLEVSDYSIFKTN